MMRILDAKQGMQMQPAPQAARQAVAPVLTRPPSMPIVPGELIGVNARLRPLWTFWSKHLRKYYLPAYATPQTPPIQRMPFLPGQADKVSDKLQLLLELDRQVEAAWKAAKLKDDDRRLAADKVISVWDAKMLSYRNVRLDGTPDIGLNVDQVGRSFRRGYTDKARREGPAAVIYV